MRLLDETRPFTGLPSLRRCGAMPLGGAVAITPRGDGTGSFAGLFRCGSVWSCPECAPVVRADRAQLMEAYAATWTEHEHGLAMATLTSRHGKHARLGPQIERTAGVWRWMLQSRWWRGFRARHQVVGVTRAVEMTHSWHTHIQRDMEAELYQRWEAECRQAPGQGRRKAPAEGPGQTNWSVAT